MMGCGWWQWNNGKLWVVAVKLWLIVGGCWWQQQNYGWLWVVVAGHELLFLVVSFSNVHTFDIFSYNWLSQKFLVVKVCIFQSLKYSCDRDTTYIFFCLWKRQKMFIEVTCFILYEIQFILYEIQFICFILYEMQFLIENAYHIYSKECLCLKEHLSRISTPFLTWNI